jgi:putative tryptophan/tyrosine transport system substrate-binding protein
MDRRTFIGGVWGGLLATSFAADAQQAARLPRIGVLFASSTGSLGAGTGADVLREGLRELGYVEGRTAVIEWRSWDGNPERLREVVAEMVRINLDVIVVGGSEASKAMKDATRSIPIVFSGPSYPVEEGLVASFARPGGNVTGITLAQSDHVAKLLQLLLDVVPALSNVGVIWSTSNPGSALLFRETETAARGLKLKVLPVPMASLADVEPALAAIARIRPGALLLNPSVITNTSAERIGELAVRLRIPSITQAKPLMELGLLMSYGADNRDVQRRIPSFVDRILKGAKPADIPVERPTKFELAINMKTAKAIGIAIPNSLLLRADTVIQ